MTRFPQEFHSHPLPRPAASFLLSVTMRGHNTAVYRENLFNQSIINGGIQAPTSWLIFGKFTAFSCMQGPLKVDKDAYKQLILSHYPGCQAHFIGPVSAAAKKKT